MDTHGLKDRLHEQAPAPAKLARGLGWFSIALGVAELVMPRTIARVCGMQVGATTVQMYGVREIATGVGILCARDPRPWLWGRVAGDVMDASTVAAHADLDDAQSMRRSGMALANVAAITALDVYTARNWQEEAAQPTYDYRDRIGMPRSPDQMRGLARKDFEAPRDMRTPEALRPWTTKPDQARHTPAGTTGNTAGAATGVTPSRAGASAGSAPSTSAPSTPARSSSTGASSTPTPSSPTLSSPT